jgi:outer membrane lipoprotein LolB
MRCLLASPAPRIFRVRTAALAAVVLLAACSTLSDQSTSLARLALRQPAENFTAAGRVAARVTGETNRGFSGGFVWTHRPAEDVVELMTPLGQIAARLTMTAAGAEIELADGRRSITSDPEQFLSEALGATLPVAALPRWLQAMPLARVPYRAEADAMGRPLTLWQNGWQIQYTAYSDETAGAYPTRMQLNQGDVEARMIVSEWNPK